MGTAVQDDKIRRELVELLYRNSYGVVISNIVISAAAIYVLRRGVATEWLLGWAGALYLLTAIRFAMSRRFFARPREGDAILRWAWLAAGFSWVSGLLWGWLGWVGFLPEEPALLSFTVIVLTGLVCGTVPSLAAFPPALIGSILATVIPVAIRCITSGSDMTGAFLFLLAALVAINFYYCRISYRMLRETITLRLENERLVDHLKEERDRAQSADRSKTRFLAAASHDLRQPIHALSLIVSTLAMLGRRGDVAAGEAVGLAGRARTIVGSLSGLLNALLDISKLDAGVVTVAREPVDLGQLFRDLDHEYLSEAHQRGLDWRVAGRDVMVDSDPMMLKRILSNLISNAFRYTARGGVLLGCRRRGDQVEIQVWDTGFGIAPEQQQTVFEEFVQLHNPARDRTQGLGLGLAIVRRTAELLGHPLKLVSRPAQGSMFSITVPLARAAAPAAPAAERGTEALARGILVVEDEPDVRDALVRLLALAGHRVHAGSSAAAAEQAYRSAAADGAPLPDLIVADYRLAGDETGVGAVATLGRALGRTIPAIIVTGDTSPERLREVSASGARILHKPIDGDELLAAIRALPAAPGGAADAAA